MIKVGSSEVVDLQFGNNEVQAVKLGNEIVWQRYADISPTNYLWFYSSSSFTLATANGAKNWDGELYYSQDGATWRRWSGMSAIESGTFRSQHSILLAGSGNTYITNATSSNINRGFVIDGTAVECFGNIMALLDYGSVDRGADPTMAARSFAYMFAFCEALRSAPTMPAQTLSESCYDNMFAYCSALTTAPTLRATTMARYCCRGMFRNCTSLTTCPALPATTLAEGCYDTMFGYCTALRRLPELPAVSLPARCYTMMFIGCSNIRLSTTQTSAYAYVFRLPIYGNVGDNDAASDATYQMFLTTGGNFTGDPAVNTTYYTTVSIVSVDAVGLIRTYDRFSRELLIVYDGENGDAVSGFVWDQSGGKVNIPV